MKTSKILNCLRVLELTKLSHTQNQAELRPSYKMRTTEHFSDFRAQKAACRPTIHDLSSDFDLPVPSRVSCQYVQGEYGSYFRETTCDFLESRDPNCGSGRREWGFLNLKRSSSTKSEKDKRSVESLLLEDMPSNSEGKEARPRRPSHQLRRGVEFFRIAFCRSSDAVRREHDDIESPASVAVESPETDKADPRTGGVLGDVSPSTS